MTSLMLQQKDTMSLLGAASFAMISVARYLRDSRKSFADASRRWYRPFLQDEREYTSEIEPLFVSDIYNHMNKGI